MNNYKKYGLLIAIIFSILFHLIIIKNFSFTFLSSNVQEDFEDMEVSLIKSFPTETKKKRIAERTIKYFRFSCRYKK